MKITKDIQISIKNLKYSVSQANNNFDDWLNYGDEYLEPTWLFEICFLQLFVITEALKLDNFRNIILQEYSDLKKSKESLLSIEYSPDQDPYSLAAILLRRYIRVLESFLPEEKTTKISKDILDIIRDVHYSITDKSIYGTAPCNENEIHIRIEGILKCVFPDLKHKPVLTKAIKNFEPDTGIASINTLIEYKFLSDKSEVGRIADEVLADTRGYNSKEWSHFIYVIYETNRFRTEKEWNNLLRQSGISNNTIIIVLSGEPTKRKKRK
jgi:hypothetical protein